MYQCDLLCQGSQGMGLTENWRLSMIKTPPLKGIRHMRHRGANVPLADLVKSLRFCKTSAGPVDATGPFHLWPPPKLVL